MVDDAGISHRLLDAVYDSISEIEEIIYNDDIGQDYAVEPDESFD